ncbi:hypothetical protein IIG_05207 [Bacillus cereus VD048]|uniref:Uncharacterized protein n=1 Tax=Bacillus cereus VD048 TaxID=1053226 RepID=J8HL65_BACCE|nr:hypothetical protein IIG_05207 [Bacillus cereus VD048]
MKRRPDIEVPPKKLVGEITIQESSKNTQHLL